MSLEGAIVGDRRGKRHLPVMLFIVPSVRVVWLDRHHSLFTTSVRTQADNQPEILTHIKYAIFFIGWHRMNELDTLELLQSIHIRMLLRFSLPC